MIMVGKAWRRLVEEVVLGATKAFTPPDATNARQTTLYFTIVNIYYLDKTRRENAVFVFEDANRVKNRVRKEEWEQTPLDLLPIKSKSMVSHCLRV
jgi:hypothetical protein